MKDSSSDDSTNEEEVIRNFELEAQAIVQEKSYPKKSSNRYLLVYNSFKKWQEENKTMSSEENVLIVYFKDLMKKLNPNTLWSIWSMLKKTLNAQENVDISKYYNLKNIIKTNTKGYKPKKSKTLNWNQIERFIKEAPNFTYLGAKALLIFGICGALRCDELVNIKLKDVEDLGTKFLVSVDITKNDVPRSFIIGPLYYNIIKTYISLRPSDYNTERVFNQFQKGKCTHQVIDRDKIVETPRDIASYLGIKDANKFTGHCFRRSGTTLLAESGASENMILQLGGWKSSTVARGYIDNSIMNKQKIFEGITHKHDNNNTNQFSTSFDAQPSTSGNNSSAITRNLIGKSTSDAQVPPTNSNSNCNTRYFDDNDPSNFEWDDFSNENDENEKNQNLESTMQKTKSTTTTVPVFTTANNSKVLVSTAKTLNLDSPVVRQPFAYKTPIKDVFKHQEKNHNAEPPPKIQKFSEEKNLEENQNNYNKENIADKNSFINYENCTFNINTMNNYYCSCKDNQKN